jgi:hypothetical protein
MTQPFENPHITRFSISVGFGKASHREEMFSSDLLVVFDKWILVENWKQ